MKNLSIAIIGSGTTGLAAALFLHRSRHRVRLFEQFDSPKPLGAGILLQPTGLAALAQLGLDKTIIERGGRIDRLLGVAASGRKVFDIAYRQLAPHYFGLGVHRGTLFSVLYDAVQREGIPITTGFQLNDSPVEGAQRYVVDKQGRRQGPFDLVVDASGYKSILRKYASVSLNRPYPYGAVWGVCEDPGQQFGKTLLSQRYDDAKVMIGSLSIGKKPGSDIPQVAFFWSLPVAHYPAWREAGLEPWKAKLLSYWPEMKPLVEQFKQVDDLTLASYGDVVLKSWHAERLAFTGDAAHCTSPQLGQGGNLGLIDAMILSQCIGREADLQAALERYSAMRRKHIRFYQRASRLLTPFFQSDSRLAALIRDVFFLPLSRIPYVRRQMLQTLAGVKTGGFSCLDPGDWHPDYAFKQREEKG